jgi:sugar O-acyltransferase (sialic acid O-acetyltransferase NeuD family)
LNSPTIDVLILGAGGHGKVVADILQCQDIKSIGFLDDNPKLWKTEYFGLPVLGPISDLHQYHPKGIIAGIGSNKIRKKIVATIEAEYNSLWVNAVHPRATIAASVRLGYGVVIAAGAVVNADTIIGNHVVVNTSATVDHDCVIEDYVHVAPGAHLAGTIHVEEGALIGIGASVIPNLSIGSWAIIGAGASVVRNVPPDVTAKGVPARWL